LQTKIPKQLIKSTETPEKLSKQHNEIPNSSFSSRDFKELHCVYYGIPNTKVYRQNIFVFTIIIV